MVETEKLYFKHLNAPFSVQPTWEHPDVDLINNQINDPEVKYLLKEKKFYLTTRQVPSCLLLTGLGLRIKPEHVGTLQELGFPLLYRPKAEKGPFRKLSGFKESVSQISEGQKSFLSSLLTKIEKENRRMFDPLYEEEQSDTEEESQYEYYDSDFETEDENEFCFDFMDPFDIIKAYHTQERLGLDQSKLLVWPGGVKRIVDQLPANLLNKIVGKGKKLFRRKIRFSQIADIELKLKIIYGHTHWGKRLSQMCGPDQGKTLSNWARNLRRRIKFFLEGKHDPIWSKTQIELMCPRLVGPADSEGHFPRGDYARRVAKVRAERFFQILRSIDGTFTQIFLGNLGAGWNWALYDQFVLSQLNQHLSDEFVDGEIYDWKILDVPTYYERLKAFRGKIKEGFLRNSGYPDLDGETSIFAGPLRLLKGLSEGHYKTQLGGVMIQTRGVGTPPPIVTLKSKIKFLKTVSAPPEPLKEFQLKFVGALVSKTLSEIPDHVFSGLTTKAGVNPTTSACLENLREEGGTSEHIRSIVREGKLGRKVQMYDLDSGTFLRFETLEQLGIGSYIFWRCLEEVRAMTPAALREAKVVMINEPGKARTVTKAHAALKCILDTINGICSYPLKKGVESSSSGMSKSNHGWNSFVSFYETEEIRRLAFKVNNKKAETTPYGTHKVTYQYEDCWMSFTDYSEATDKMDHRIASFVAERWMLKCGIPKLLRGIVHETCFKPRTVYYDATGVLAEIGDPSDTRYGNRYVTLQRGVLMGDPLTKVVLHLMNKGVRDSGRLVSLCDNPLSLLPQYKGIAIMQIAQLLDDYKSSQ